MEGGTLHDYLKAQQSTINDQERMRVVQQLAAGMSYLHSREVLHPATPLRNPLTRYLPQESSAEVQGLGLGDRG